MGTPISNINDGYEFQQIVAEYFRCLKTEPHEYNIVDITVEDYGVGGDDGCDILVEFYFEDAIKKYSRRWVIECKCHTNAVGNSHLNLNNISAILKANNASGYLLICKNDASASLKRTFKQMNQNGECDYEIWNGSHLWSLFSRRTSLLQAFFPNFYKQKFIDTKALENYEDLVKQFEKRLKE